MSGPVLVDTDPGIDDALALHYLVATGGWDLKAITAVAGNVPLSRAVANARGLAALLGIERDVPVYGGCPKPLMRDLETARSEEHTSELQSRQYLVCRLLLEK